FVFIFFFFFSSRRRHTRSYGDWSSDVCSSDLKAVCPMGRRGGATDGFSSAAGRNRATAGRKIMIRVGVLGYGYWGPNIVRNFHAHEQSEVVLVCDKSLKAGERLRKAYPGIPFTADENEILHSTKIDAVCVITPVASHYSLAKRALENGKHIFVE